MVAVPTTPQTQFGADRSTIGRCIHVESGSSPWVLGHLVLDWWRHWGRNSGGGDVSDEDQRLFQSVIHPQHLIPPLSLLWRLLHQTALVHGRVQVGQQLRVDEVLRLEARREVNTDRRRQGERESVIER